MNWRDDKDKSLEVERLQQQLLLLRERTAHRVLFYCGH
jgi:hypothetical protein